MSAPSQRNESLDVLRCVAVLLVVGYHMPYYTLWSRIGWIGVDLFFVLSGFLISGLLFQEYKDTGTLDIKRFLIRRGLKIYPSFYLLMVLVTCLYFLIVQQYPQSNSWQVGFFYKTISRGKGFRDSGPYLVVGGRRAFLPVLPAVLMTQIAVFPKRDPFRLIPVIFLAIARILFSISLFIARGLHP